jgi:hypothetical protein
MQPVKIPNYSRSINALHNVAAGIHNPLVNRNGRSCRDTIGSVTSLSAEAASSADLPCRRNGTIPQPRTASIPVVGLRSRSARAG